MQLKNSLKWDLWEKNLKKNVDRDFSRAPSPSFVSRPFLCIAGFPLFPQSRPCPTMPERRLRVSLESNSISIYCFSAQFSSYVRPWWLLLRSCRSSRTRLSSLSFMERMFGTTRLWATRASNFSPSFFWSTNSLFLRSAEFHQGEPILIFFSNPF